MPALERTVVGFKPDEVHPDFRLWLTSLPTPKFPVSVLQNGVKLTKEPSKGLRANLRSSYYSFNESFLDRTTKPDVFKKLVFSLCFFHAVILERRKFGPLGWNIPYAFSESDLQVCLTQLEEFLDLYEDVPYEVVHFLSYDVNYGGRVTDDQVLITLITLITLKPLIT
jgi:dynein heavy chain